MEAPNFLEDEALWCILTSNRQPGGNCKTKLLPVYSEAKRIPFLAVLPGLKPTSDAHAEVQIIGNQQQTNLPTRLNQSLLISGTSNAADASSLCLSSFRKEESGMLQLN